MRALFALCVALAGCAGSKPDLDFRAKVASDTATVGVTPLGFTVSDTLTFRDPAKTGTAK